MPLFSTPQDGPSDDSRPDGADRPTELPRGLRLVAALTDLSYRHSWLFVAGALLITLGAVGLSSRLEIRSSFAELLPENLPSVANLKELIRRVGGDGTVLLSIEAVSPDPDGLAKAEAWAPLLANEIRALGPEETRSVEDNVQETEDWYSSHWPLFVPLADLTKARDALAAEIHARKLAANPLDFDRGKTQPDEVLPLSADVAPWLDPSQPMPREKVAEHFAKQPGGFYVHPDHRSVTVIVRPAGTSLSVGQSRALLDRLRAIIESHRSELARDGLRVGFGGTFPQTVAEYEAILHDIASTALLVTALVLATLLIFFREIRSVLVLLLSVLVALAVTFGLTQLSIGYLNTETAFLGAIVVGNGINYGLIYLARVRQLRQAGVGLPAALREGALVAARATLLAAAASSVSFGVLAVAANRGFRHFGFIGGLGMLLCWVATFVLLPAFLAVVERLWPENRARLKLTAARASHPWLELAFRHPRWLSAGILGLALGGAALFLVRLPHAMETNLDHLSNQISNRENRELARDNARAQTSLGRSIAGTLVLLPSAQIAERYCQVIRERMRDPQHPEVAAVIDGCDSLSSVVPSEQTEKLALIGDIATRLSEGLLQTLPAAQAQRLRAVRADLLAQRPLTVAEAPKVLIDRFRERDGSVGNLAVVTAKPDAKLELSPRLISFANAVRDVRIDGQRYDATGDSVILADLLDDIDREGPKTTVLSFAGVCLLVMVFFSQWRRRLEVLVSLVTGVAIMAGAATLLGIRINFFNFIVFPITFGIAVDYGANISARIRARNGQVLAALAEVGPAVFVCSLTSIIGYFSLFFSINRALRSFGWYAITGELASIFTALLLLPALALGFEALQNRRWPGSSGVEARPRSAA